MLPSAELAAPPVATEEEEASAPAIPAPSWLGVVGRFFAVTSIFFWYGLRRLVPRALGGLSGPVALRRAFEHLGPIYVKLGQLIASGEALFPAAYAEEFRALLDRVAPIPWDTVKQEIEHDLGRPIGELYAQIDPVPLAAASIAQVHTATLHDGTEVVVKVQRPGIARRAASDVAIMRLFARALSAVSPLVRNSNAVAFVDDFRANLERELDFRLEAQRMREFAEVMAQTGNRDTAAPKVHASLTHARVMTMERFRGCRIDDVDAVRASGFDIEERLLQGIRAWFQPLILRGFFHGDVHAGNFMLLRDGRIGFLDFGICGDLGEMDRQGVIDFVIGFQQRDFEKVAGAMLAVGSAVDPDAIDRERFARDVGETFAPLSAPDRDFGLRDLVPGLIRAGRTHGLRMPRDLVLVTKQLVYLDRITRTYGGANRNVLTDQRLTNLIMQDVFAAMFA
jgi:predicted unusual protein kinase regulating ubiquinone biosynthesis (AarF/ABC1/UbiB family)